MLIVSYVFLYKKKGLGTSFFLPLAIIDQIDIGIGAAYASPPFTDGDRMSSRKKSNENIPMPSFLFFVRRSRLINFDNASKTFTSVFDARTTF
jgi:hypothetical protein